MIAQTPPNLNRPQEDAVNAPDIPLLIVAGAGTGKTRTLTMRILNLLKRGVPPSRICALTFTNKAAREIEERVLTAYQSSEASQKWAGEPPFLGTFHSLGSRILRKEGRQLGRNAGFVIYDDQDSMSVLKKAIKALGIEEEKEKGTRSKGPAILLDKISKLKNGILKLPAMHDRSPEEEQLGKIFVEYEKGLETNNAFDFDDLIQKVVHLFKHHPDILAKYHGRYSHFLVDEYQDINNTQYEMVKILAAPTGNISVVGDDQQTIYSWRGSNFEIFMNFERDWPNAQVVVLDQNYRSSQTIINASSALISNNKRQKPKTLWTSNALGEKIKLTETLDGDDEAEWIVDEIAQKMKEARIDGKDPGTMAILYRTNAQSRAIEQSLLRRNIAYKVYGGLKFYERKEIRDIVAALRLALNPQDGASKERLEKAYTKKKYNVLEEALAVFAARPVEQKTPVEVIKTFLTSMDYFNYIDRTQTNPIDRRENITALIEFAETFQTLDQMVEEISLLQATDALQKHANAAGKGVELMTMHLAKGLEFDSVFIAGASEGLLPHSRSIESEAETEEERRIMYVAMTRARKHLAISFYDIPSRFLSEIPDEYVQFTSLVSSNPKDFDDEERYISWD